MISLASNTIGIGLAVSLRDMFTSRSRAIESEFKRLHGSAQRVMKDNLRAAQGFGIGMAAAGAVITAQTNKALAAFTDFEHTMKTVELVAEGTGKNFRATKEELAALDALATELGTNTIFNPQQVASGMEYLAKAGYKVKEILTGNIQAVTYLAGALDKPVGGKGGTADFMTHIMKSFQIGPKGAMKVADWIAETSLSSTADLEDLHEALIHVSGTAMNLRIPLQNVLAMLAKLSDSGLRGSIGGTSLNNMLIQFSNAIGDFASPKDRKVLQAMGLDITKIVDAAGNLRPITMVLDELDRALSNKGDIEKTSMLNALLNIRGGRAVAPLLRVTEGAKSVRDYINEISRADGVAKRIATERMDTLWGSFERLRDTTWNFFKTWGAALKPVLKPLVDVFITLVQLASDFVQTPVGKVMAVLVAAGGAALLVFGSLLTAFTTIKLLTLASTFSFANMGRSLVLAWTQGAAAAARYATIAGGAMAVSTPMGMRWRSLSTGKFTKAPGGILTGGGFMASLRNFGKGLSFLGGAMRILGAVVRVITGPIGWILAALSALGMLKTVVLSLVYGLGTLVNAIIWVVHSLWAMLTDPLGSIAYFSGGGKGSEMEKANERFVKGQENMAKALGLYEEGPKFTPIKQTHQWDGLIEQNRMKTDSLRQARGIQKTTLQVDGKVLGEVTQETLDRLRYPFTGNVPLQQ